MLKFFETLLIGWTDSARRGGWLTAIAIFALAGAAIFYALSRDADGERRLRVNTDTSTMIDGTLPFQVRARELREAFPDIKTDIAVVIRAPTLDEADAFAAELRSRTLEKKDFFDDAFAPAAEPFFRANGLLYLATDELESNLNDLTRAASLIETLVKAPTAGQMFATLAENDELAEKSELGGDTLTRIYAELAKVVSASVQGQTEPFSWLGALSDEPAPEGGHQRMVYVTPKLDFSRLQPAKPAITELRAEIVDIRKKFDGRVETYITGDPALRADELAAVATGIELSFLISFLSVGLLLLICFRSVFLTIVTLSSLVLSIMITAGFAAATIGELNLVSVAFTVLLVGLGIDYAIHLLLHYQERRRDGLPLADALKGAVHEVGPGLVLACFTTALGFFAFVPTAFDGIAQLGVIAGFGVVIALFVSLTFTPAMLGAFSNGKIGKTRVRRKSESKLLGGFQTPIAALTVLIGIGALFLLPKARFDADPMALRDPNSQSVVGFNLLFNDANTIPYRLTRLVNSEEDALATATKAKELKTVRSARTLLNFVPEDQDDKLELISFAAGSLVFALGAEEDKSAAPSATDGAASLIGRLEGAYAEGTPQRRLAAALQSALAKDPSLAKVEANIFAYWPALIERLRDQMNADYVDRDMLPENLRKRYKSDGGKWRVDILPAGDPRDPKTLKTFVDSVETAFPDIAGGAVQTQKAGEIISAAMLQASAIALGVIAIFLWILLRRLGDVLLILFPLALAAALTTAAGVLFNIPFNYANVIVLPLLMGIGVDSAIHLVMRERQTFAGEDRHGGATPAAVLFSALTTVASFGSLMLSSHRGTASMGELLAIAIGFTLLCTLIVLPVAFRFTNERRKR